MAVRYKGQFKRKFKTRNERPEHIPKSQEQQDAPAKATNTGVGVVISLRDLQPSLMNKGKSALELQPLKVQRPLNIRQGDKDLKCLVYNLSRSVQYEVPYDDIMKAAFQAGAKNKMYPPQKIYCMGKLKVGEIPGEYTFEMDSRLPDQPW